MSYLQKASLMYSAKLFKDSTAFEHHEMKDHLQAYHNPPIRNYYPGAPEGEDRKLRKYHMYGIAWMESRLEAGGGIIGDQIGLGKVRLPVITVTLRDTEFMLTDRHAKS